MSSLLSELIGPMQPLSYCFFREPSFNSHNCMLPAEVLRMYKALHIEPDDSNAGRLINCLTSYLVYRTYKLHHTGRHLQTHTWSRPCLAPQTGRQELQPGLRSNRIQSYVLGSFYLNNLTTLFQFSSAQAGRINLSRLEGRWQWICAYPVFSFLSYVPFFVYNLPFLLPFFCADSSFSCG